MPSRAVLGSVGEFGNWLIVEFQDMPVDDFNKIIDKAEELFGWEPAREPIASDDHWIDDLAEARALAESWGCED